MRSTKFLLFLLFMIMLIFLIGCMTTPNISNNEELPTNVSYRALLVGVGEYQASNIADLSSPPYDVERVKKNLELCHFGPENITFSSIETLINGQANKSNILQSITSTFYQADNNDISYFYFTGHGSYTNNCSYLCPYDVSDNTSSAISVSELENALSAIPGTKVVILDSCFSGGFIGKNVSLHKESQKDFNQNIIQVFFEKQFGRNITGSQYQVITASKSSQTAFGVETQPGYNPFSLMTLLFCESSGYDYLIDSYKNLLPADINNDEIVSLQEAYDYIQKEMDILLPLLEAQFDMELEQDVQVYPFGSTFALIERDFGLEENGTYSLRDIGPAGGYIFYDKGYYSDGWRYLEAAPVSTEWTLKQWGSYGTLIGGTGTGIGTGQSNTTIIVTWLNSHSETDKAAQLCNDLTEGGYSDWFLPSKYELNLMYTNLKVYGVGGFADNKGYWSSSEGGATSAWYQWFNNGFQYDATKYNIYRVRAVRVF